MAKKLFDAIDEKIIRTLYNEGIPMTLGQISHITSISWITVKRHIDKLLKLDIVIEIKTETRKTPKVQWNFDEFGNLAVATT